MPGLTPDQQAAIAAVCAPAGAEAARLEALLAQAAAPLNVPAGGLIFEHGDQADSTFLVVRGSVEEWRDEAPLTVRQPKDFVGELAVLHPGSRRQTEARARQDSELLEIPAALYLAACKGPGGGALTQVAGQHARGLLKSLTQAFLRLRLAFFPERHGPDPKLSWTLDRALLTPVTLPTWASERYPENVLPNAPGTWASDGQGWILHARNDGTTHSSFTALLAPVRTEAPAPVGQGLLVLACWSDDFLDLTWLREVLGWPAMYGHVELGGASQLGGGHRRVVFRTEGGQAWALQGKHRNFGSAWATGAVQTILPHPSLGNLPPTATAGQVHAAISALPSVNLYWRRSFFRPGLSADAGPSWAWKPQDFTADELVSMRVQLTPSQASLQLVELGTPALAVERPWKAGEAVPGGAALGLRGALVSSSVNVELDYKVAFAGQPAPAKLTWGPGAWIPAAYIPTPPARPRPVDRQRFRLDEPDIELRGLNAAQQALARALTREPALERLSTATLEGLVKTLLPTLEPQQTLSQGDLLYAAGAPLGAKVWVILDGRISIWLADVLIEERIRGQLVGCEPQIFAMSPQMTTRAARPSLLQPLAWTQVLAAMAVSEPFRLWVQTQPLSALNQAEELADIQEGASGSLFVGPQGDLLPGPYTAADVELTLLSVGAPDQVRALPPGLKAALVPGGRWFLMLARFQDFGHHALSRRLKTYTEVSLIRRVRVGLRPYYWFEVIKPDNVMALAAGREIYGYPKLWDRANFGNNRVRLRRAGGALDVAFRSADDGSLATQVANPILEEWANLIKPPGSLTGVPFLARRRVPRLKGTWGSWQPGDWHQDALVLSWISVEALEDIEFLVRRDPNQTHVQLPMGAGTVLTMPWLTGTAMRVRATMSLVPHPDDEVAVDYLTANLSAAEEAQLKDW